MNLLLIRLIIFAVLFFAGLKLYRMYREWKLDREDASTDPAQLEGGKMVPCTWCRVHTPQAEAIREGDHWFCSSAHRDRFLQEQPPEA